MNSCQKYFSTCLLATAALLAGASPAWAQSSFAVLGSAAVSCTDGNITGQVGTNQALGDVPPGAVTLVRCPTGGVHVGDQAAKDAFSGFLNTYAALAPKAGDVCTTLTGTLAGMTLSPGTYCFPAAATLTGLLTLDGPATGIWTFKIGSVIATPPALPTGALTGTDFSVVMAGGGQACNVTWWVAEAATMTDSNLKGSILAGAATTLTRGTLIGSDFAKAGATITGTTVVGCGAAQGGGGGPGACSDRVTGHGSINITTTNKAKFGVTAGINKKGKVRGHLTYIDDKGTNTKSDDVKVKGKVTTYLVTGDKTRHIEGTARIRIGNGAAVTGTFTVDVTDGGPGGTNDTFAITLSTPANYSKSGTLASGNIQIKRRCDRNGDDDGDDDDDDDRDDDGDDDGDKKD